MAAPDAQGKPRRVRESCHVTAVSPHAGTRQNGMTFRGSEIHRINQIAVGITSRTAIKRFRFPLAMAWNFSLEPWNGGIERDIERTSPDRLCVDQAVQSRTLVLLLSTAVNL